MDLSAKVLGENIVAKLNERRVTPILKIGSNTFTRAQLSRVDCFNFTAAQNLSAILNKHFKVPHLRHVFDHISPSELALPHLGAVSLAVLGAAFEAAGIGGDSPLENYIKKHLTGGSKMVTFNSLKLRDQKEVSEERKRTKARRNSRRDRAHAIRSERFNVRSAARHAEA